MSEQAVKAALHASQARLYPDAAYEKYLDELSASLADMVGDAEPDSLEDAALRQAADAISHLRRTRDELRRDLNNVALAALPPSSPVADSAEIEFAQQESFIEERRRLGLVIVQRFTKTYEKHGIDFDPDTCYEAAEDVMKALEASAPSPSAGAAKDKD